MFWTYLWNMSLMMIETLKWVSFHVILMATIQEVSGNTLCWIFEISSFLILHCLNNNNTNDNNNNNLDTGWYEVLWQFFFFHLNEFQKSFPLRCLSIFHFIARIWIWISKQRISAEFYISVREHFMPEVIGGASVTWTFCALLTLLS